jgi:hypothetical protein
VLTFQKYTLRAEICRAGEFCVYRHTLELHCLAFHTDTVTPKVCKLKSHQNSKIKGINSLIFTYSQSITQEHKLTVVIAVTENKLDSNIMPIKICYSEARIETLGMFQKYHGKEEPPDQKNCSCAHDLNTINIKNTYSQEVLVHVLPSLDKLMLPVV